MFRTSALILFGVLSLVGVRAANAQGPAASDAVKAMLGAWELSNADHDKSCMVTFKIETAGSGRAIELDKSCLAAFPIIRDIAAWTLGKDDALRRIWYLAGIFDELRFFFPAEEVRNLRWLEMNL